MGTTGVQTQPVAYPVVQPAQAAVPLATMSYPNAQPQAPAYPPAQPQGYARAQPQGYPPAHGGDAQPGQSPVVVYDPTGGPVQPYPGEQQPYPQAGAPQPHSATRPSVL